jgi:hypothetical protein
MNTASTLHTHLARHTGAACRDAFDDLIARGVRLEISHAIDELLPYHRSLGYIPLRVPAFLHPVWGTVSRTLCFLADRMLPGSVNARLPVVADPVPVSGIVSSHETSSTEVAV